MTNANAEAQRRWRQRQQEKKKEDLRKGAGNSAIFKAPFFEFVQDDIPTSDFDVALALAGIEAPRFADDRGPDAHALPDVMTEGADYFEGAQGSLGRAEVMVGCLIEAAQWLAASVNDYKQAEIEARLAELETSDLSDPETRKAALQEAARLNKMQEALNKQIRMTFPQWKVTG